MEVAEHILEILETLDGVIRPGNEPSHGLEQVAQTLGRDAGLVAFVLIRRRLDVLELREQQRRRVTYPRCQRFGERRRRRCPTVVAHSKRLAIRRKRALESSVKLREPAVDVILEDGVGFCLTLRERRHEPGQSRSLSSSDRAALLPEPREMHFEVSARSRVAREVPEPAPQLS